MANCKDCIHYDVCESDSEDVALNLTWANKCQHFKDKADVVPKSEVERLRGQVNRLKKYDEERDVALHARLINETKADTVRKMQESLKECFDSESDFPTQTHGYIRYTVDQIAKEILGGNNNGN